MFLLFPGEGVKLHLRAGWHPVALSCGSAQRVR